MIHKLLAHPLTKNMDLDDPRITLLRRQILNEKTFLNKIYQEWYSYFVDALPEVTKPVLEIGSGAGFLVEYIPNLLTSDLFPSPWLSVVINGQRLPFADQSLSAIVMINVLHHLPCVRDFLAEATRCVEVSGRLAMVEPWVTSWSSLIYDKLHHEPFDPLAVNWTSASFGPLTGANSALPWIIFNRDLEQFEHEFPQWRVHDIRLFMPFRYLISGGISMRSFMPYWTFKLWHLLENCLKPWMDKLAMFALIVLEKEQ